MNDEKKIELNEHPDEEADKWDMKTSTRWAEIPDEWTDKSKDLNKHPDADDLHGKKNQVTINSTEIPDEWTDKSNDLNRHLDEGD